MNITRLKPLDLWKSCSGLCLICGTPMAIEMERKLVKENYDEAALPDVDDDAEDGMHSNDELVQENFVRVGLFRFNLLGKMDRCHLIDAYTFLGTLDAFLKALQECRHVVQLLGGDFEKDIRDNTAMFDKASDYCQRVANKVLMPGCKACNLVMSRPNAHGDIVYRCFSRTAELNVPELEDSMSRTIKKGNKIKHVLQQIALYFDYDEERKKWRARDDSEIMPLASLWRCVANLCLWGKGGMARYRLVAIFYAAVILYERLLLKDTMLFVDWHTHVFRLFYMREVPEGTFFGIDHSKAAITFNTTRKAGPIWCSVVEHHLASARDKLETFLATSVSMRQVLRFKNTIISHVNSEKALFCYLCQRAGVRNGIRAIMSFYLYNFKDARSMLLYKRGKLFTEDMILAVRRELPSLKTTTGTSSSSLLLSLNDLTLVEDSAAAAAAAKGEEEERD